MHVLWESGPLWFHVSFKRQSSLLSLLVQETALSSVSSSVSPIRWHLIQVKILPVESHIHATIIDSRSSGNIMNEEWAHHLGIPPPRPLTMSLTMPCSNPPEPPPYAYIRITSWDNTVPASSFSLSAVDFVAPWLCQWRWSTFIMLWGSQNQWHQMTSPKCTRNKTYLYWSWWFDERIVYVQLSCSQEWFSPSIVVLKAPWTIYGPSLRRLAPSSMLLHFIRLFSTPLYVLISSISSALHCLTSALFLFYYFLWFQSWKRIVLKKKPTSIHYKYQ